MKIEELRKIVYPHMKKKASVLKVKKILRTYWVRSIVDLPPGKHEEFTIKLGRLVK